MITDLKAWAGLSFGSVKPNSAAEKVCVPLMATSNVASAPSGGSLAGVIGPKVTVAGVPSTVPSLGV